MGAACCCLRPQEFEDLAYINGSVYGHCMCLRCFVHQLLHAYTSLFRRGEIRAVTSSTQGATPLASPGQVSPMVDNSFSDVYRSPPRPLPYDIDSRYSRLQRDSLISRREKASCHFHDESEPLQRSGSSSGLDSLRGKWNGTDYEEQSKIGRSDSPSKHLLTKVASGVTCTFPSSEDEDVCPTCLEDYTPEDPKIMTQCSHHFHLGCIYEWMERSDSCPVCGKAWGDTTRASKDPTEARPSRTSLVGQVLQQAEQAADPATGLPRLSQPTAARIVVVPRAAAEGGKPPRASGEVTAGAIRRAHTSADCSGSICSIGRTCTSSKGSA